MHGAVIRERCVHHENRGFVPRWKALTPPTTAHRKIQTVKVGAGSRAIALALAGLFVKRMQPRGGVGSNRAACHECTNEKNHCANDHASAAADWQAGGVSIRACAVLAVLAVVPKTFFRIIFDSTSHLTRRGIVSV